MALDTRKASGLTWFLFEIHVIEEMKYILVCKTRRAVPIYI